MKMIQERERLNDVFPGWLTGSGIFAVLQTLNVPWNTLDISASLDLEYYGNYSGEKLISPLVEKLLVDGTLTDARILQLANVLVNVCGANWTKQWETLSAQYNPIENYSMTEEMTNDETLNVYGKTRTRTNNLSHVKSGTETDTPDITETRTNDLTHAKTGTETDTPNFIETQTPELTNATENTVHGFNSTVGVPTGEQTQKATGTNTTTQTGTDAREYNTTDKDTGTVKDERKGTDTHTYNTTDTDTGTQTDNDGGTDKQTRNYKLTRSGNIGVTTSQQMLESERNLWMWYYFFEVVFPDLDRVLTIPIY